jgi:hypothetical protein
LEDKVELASSKLMRTTSSFTRQCINPRDETSGGQRDGDGQYPGESKGGAMIGWLLVVKNEKKKKQKL